MLEHRNFRNIRCWRYSKLGLFENFNRDPILLALGGMSELRNNFRNITTLEFPLVLTLGGTTLEFPVVKDFDVLTLGLSALKDFSITSADS